MLICVDYTHEVECIVEIAEELELIAETNDGNVVIHVVHFSRILLILPERVHMYM